MALAALALSLTEAEAATAAFAATVPEVAATVGTLEAGMQLGSTLASGAELGGLASIFSNPTAMLGGAPAAEAAITPQIAESFAANQMETAAAQEAMRQQAAQQTLQNSFGSQAFKPLTPPTPADLLRQQQVINAFQQSAANPIDPSQFQQFEQLASGTVPEVVPKAADALKYSNYPATSPIDTNSPYFTQLRSAINTPDVFNPTVANAGEGVTQLADTAPNIAEKVAEQAAKVPTLDKQGNFASNMAGFFRDPSMANFQEYLKLHPYASSMGAYALYNALKGEPKQPKPNRGMIRPYTFNSQQNLAAYEPQTGSAERNYFTNSLVASTPYRAAAGGIVALGVGGPVEQMSAQNAIGNNETYPQANLNTAMYSNPMIQRPVAQNVIQSGVDIDVDPFTGEQRFARGGVADPEKSPGYKYSYDPNTMQFTQASKPVEVAPTATYGQYGPVGRTTPTWASEPTNIVSGGMAQPFMPSGGQAYNTAPVQPYQSPEQQMGLGGFYNDMDAQLSAMGYAAGGGISHLGDYSDGGRLLKGPGDGVSDSIPASIGGRQPARLADGEFVVPARIVSELGNGSTEAGARKLYAMMDRIQKARKKSVGKEKVAVDSKTDKYLPA